MLQFCKIVILLAHGLNGEEYKFQQYFGVFMGVVYFEDYLSCSHVRNMNILMCSLEEEGFDQIRSLKCDKIQPFDEDWFVQHCRQVNMIETLKL